MGKQKIELLPVRWPRMRMWKISDHSGNGWVVTFTGDVGEFTVSGTMESGVPFKVWLYLSGDRFEIMKATEGRRNIKSDRLLRKYRPLGCMVSNYFRFNIIVTRIPQSVETGENATKK